MLDAGVERQLRLNEGEGIHSVYRPRAVWPMASGITFLLAPAFNPAPYAPEQVQRVAIIGLAAGTMAKLFTEAYGPIPIDGAELDPAILAAGRAWFDMNEPNLTAVAAMGGGSGTQSAAHRRRYDLIAVDAYRPPYIPFHLTTVEFFPGARPASRRWRGGSQRGPHAHRLQPGGCHRGHDAAGFPSVYVVDEPDGGVRWATAWWWPRDGPTTWRISTPTCPLSLGPARSGRANTRSGPCAPRPPRPARPSSPMTARRWSRWSTRWW